MIINGGIITILLIQNSATNIFITYGGSGGSEDELSNCEIIEMNVYNTIIPIPIMSQITKEVR